MSIMSRTRALAGVLGAAATLVLSLIAATDGAASAAIPTRVTDTTPPVITAARTPSTPDGNNGWYKSAVSVSFTVSDPDSPITNQSFDCSGRQQLNNTSGVTFTCQA